MRPRRDSAGATTRAPLPGVLTAELALEANNPTLFAQLQKLQGTGGQESARFVFLALAAATTITKPSFRLTRWSALNGSTGQIPKNSRRQRPDEASLARFRLCLELDQAGGSLLQLHRRPIAPSDQVRHQATELRLMTDDGDDRLIAARQPGDGIVQGAVRLQLARDLDAIQLVLRPDDVGGLARSRQRAGNENVDARHELAKSPGAAFHLPCANGRERTQSVITAASGENLSVLGDRVPNDEQFHGGVMASCRRGP